VTATRIDLVADIGEVLVSEEQIAAKVAELGARIGADYGDRRLTLVSVLKGSLPFMADLMRAIPSPVRIDLMEVSSYGGTSTESSGLVRILKDLSATIEGEDVLIVEDIIDTGLTLNYLGFTIPDQFVVGYGLDYGEYYRNLRFVGVLRPEVYTSPD
jgi:hypoxanthine phosphoribosyltransferase